MYQIPGETKKTLGLVSTAGSAPTSTLKLPALGANVGPEGEKRYPINSVFISVSNNFLDSADNANQMLIMCIVHQLNVNQSNSLGTKLAKYS